MYKLNLDLIKLYYWKCCQIGLLETSHFFAIFRNVAVFNKCIFKFYSIKHLWSIEVFLQTKKLFLVSVCSGVRKQRCVFLVLTKTCNEPKRAETRQNDPKFWNLGNLQFFTSFRFSNFLPKCLNLGLLAQKVLTF